MQFSIFRSENVTRKTPSSLTQKYKADRFQALCSNLTCSDAALYQIYLSYRYLPSGVSRSDPFTFFSHFLTSSLHSVWNTVIIFKQTELIVWSTQSPVILGALCGSTPVPIFTTFGFILARRACYSLSLSLCVCACRLQQLDRHCQSSAQQVCELLAKQNQLMQERNALSEEMQNLRTEVQTHTSPTRSVWHEHRGVWRTPSRPRDDSVVSLQERDKVVLDKRIYGSEFTGKR